MDCPFPITLRSQGIRVPCGHCAVCRQNKIDDWTTRLRKEAEASFTSYFVTLTYDDDHLPHDENGNPCFSKKHIQDFHKRMRQTLKRGHFLDPVFSVRIHADDRPFRYYLIAEYGGADDHEHRPHYHGVYFDLPDDVNTAYLLVRHCWQQGTVVDVSPLTPGRMAYTLNYTFDLDLNVMWNPSWMRPFSLMSKGLGAQALRSPSMLDWWRSSPHNRVYYPDHGTKLRLPRYLKDKIFDDDMKARILDKRQEMDKLCDERESSEDRTRRVLSYFAFEHSVRNRIKRTKSHV